MFKKLLYIRTWCLCKLKFVSYSLAVEVSKSFLYYLVNKMASIQLHIGSDEEVLSNESSCIKKANDFFQIIRDESMENPCWLCTDISLTISKRRLLKWISHIILIMIWVVICLLNLALISGVVIFLSLSAYYWMGIAGIVIFWLLVLAAVTISLTIILVLKAKKEGRFPGHCNFLVKFCNSLQTFCES